MSPCGFTSSPVMASTQQAAQLQVVVELGHLQEAGSSSPDRHGLAVGREQAGHVVGAALFEGRPDRASGGEVPELRADTAVSRIRPPGWIAEESMAPRLRSGGPRGLPVAASQSRASPTCPRTLPGRRDDALAVSA